MIKDNAAPSILANRIVSNWVTRISKTTLELDISRGGGVCLFNPYQLGRPRPLVAENLIADNRADDPGSWGRGGGLCCHADSVQLINNTLMRNLSLCNGANNPDAEGPGNLHFLCSLPSFVVKVVNNIILDGSSGSLKGLDFGGPAYFSNNCFFSEVTTNYQGSSLFLGTNGNFFADPRLDESSGLPRLQTGSPCIDAGDDSVAEVSTTDLSGGLRWRGTHIDLGAVEFVPPLRLHSPRRDPAGSYLSN